MYFHISESGDNYFIHKAYKNSWHFADIYKDIFSEWKYMYFDGNSTEICTLGFNRPQFNIGSVYGLAQKRPQALSVPMLIQICDTIWHPWVTISHVIWHPSY